MPSVGMRRSTRVFGTRVLRSGRRLFSEPHEGGKQVRVAHGENKFQGLLDNSADGGGGIDVRPEEFWQENENISLADLAAELKIEVRESDGVKKKNVDKKCGIVYKRKRKRAELTTTTGLVEDGRYAKKYTRKQWRTRCRAIESFGTCGSILDSDRTREFAVAVNKSSYDCYHWITCFMTSLLSYMAKARIGMRQLSAFMLSKPIFDAYYSSGMLCLQDHITARKPCACIVSGSGSAIPLFCVNIYAIPPLFVHIQTSIYLRSAHLDCALVGNCENNEEVLLVADDDEEPSLQIPSRRDQQDCVCESSEISSGSNISHNNVVASDNDTSGGRHSAVGFPKSAIRSLQLRNSRNIQKRRSSMRRKRGRPPSALRGQKGREALASEVLRIRYDGSQSSAASPSRLHRSSDKRRQTTNIKELKSAMGVAPQDVCASSCSANLLITDTDKCYRVEGATIAVEVSASKQLLLSVSKGGTKQCSLVAQKVMRPSSSNPFTNAIIWSGDGGLKFEFPDKQDWIIFKELYKECSERNVQSPATSVIPVPGVQEVSNPVDQYPPFVRPESYITLKDDELNRALMKKSANYDMDSDDEEWLAKMNSELNAGRELQEFITPENFECIIDALEKGLHCAPRKQLDMQAAYDCCIHLEGKEVIEAIYKYWIRKRKQKRSALLTVFQLYQPRRSEVIPKFVLRKKRSFKRKASQSLRGKQRPLYRVIAGEGDGLEQKNNEDELQEAKHEYYEGVASEKRQRAQMLMENADLATYKAMMALRIAEAAAQVEEAPERVASYFLDLAMA